MNVTTLNNLAVLHIIRFVEKGCVCVVVHIKIYLKAFLT